MGQPIGRPGQVVEAGHYWPLRVPCSANEQRRSSASTFQIANLRRRTGKKRSQKDKTTWDRFMKPTDDWLPKPRILHRWPRQRFAVKHPSCEPDVRIGPVRICAVAHSLHSVYFFIITTIKRMFTQAVQKTPNAGKKSFHGRDLAAPTREAGDARPV
jgi:hypothetical protein